MLLRRVVVLCILFVGAASVWAQEGEDAESDSLMWEVDLAEIVVRAAERREAVTTTLQRVDLADFNTSDAGAVDGVVRLIPAAHRATNSRGETLVYLRSAGERQVALFFDGALLNVPWDNRFDLALVPAGVVGGMTVAKGVPSVLYGTNALAGALNLTSRTLTNPGVFTEAKGLLGTSGLAQAALTHLRRTRRFDAAFSVGYARQDGLAVPDDAGLPFNQTDDDLRTNTDRRLFNLFGRIGYRFGGGAQLAASVLHLDAEKGVAPEGHLDPDRFSVRYWRYPDWRTSMLIVNGAVPLGRGGTLLSGALWASRFGQIIDAFQSIDYEALDERQVDDDLTLGSRLILVQPAGAGTVRMSLNALTSRHEQDVQPFAADGTPQLSDPPQTFQQHVWSVGSEYEWQPTERLEVLVGGSLDGIATPQTGDKPARDPQLDVGFTAGARYAQDDAWALRAAAGRKVRFPTMRELFSGALGRILVNPDLRPESSLLAEVGAEMRRETASGEVVLFLNRTFDTIDQRAVQLPGEDRPRRQRVNLDGSRVFGVEAVGAGQPLQGLTVMGSLTYTHARTVEDGDTERFVERPEWLGTLTLDYNAPAGLSALLQGVYTGRAYGLTEENAFVPLPTSFVINARLAFRVTRVRQRVLSAELFARVDNLTDETVLPQLGLPGPGRTFRAGVDVAF